RGADRHLEQEGRRPRELSRSRVRALYSRTTASSGQRLAAFAAARSKPLFGRKGLGRNLIENRSASPNGASTCSRSLPSSDMPTANIGEAKRSSAAAVEESGE